MAYLRKMKSLSFLIVFFYNLIYAPALLGQYYVVGDTSSYHFWNIGQTYTPNDTVDFDLDCDGISDLSFISIDGNAPGFPWDRLSMGLGNGVEVCNSGTGFVTGFETGDTVLFDIANWTPFLDFIYGTGAAGAYGQAAIANKYLGFRKTITDTVYTFIRFSNQGLVFTIHEIISPCSQTPLLSGIANWDSAHPTVFPNPCNDHFTVQNSQSIDWIQVFDASGTSILSQKNGEIDFAPYPSGLYFVKTVKHNGTSHCQKLFKL